MRAVGARIMRDNAIVVHTAAHSSECDIAFNAHFCDLNINTLESERVTGQYYILDATIHQWNKWNHRYQKKIAKS